MQTHRIITAKLHPEYWGLIHSREKTIEARDNQDTGVCAGDVFQFIHPTTREILGYARIKAMVELPDGWTLGMVAGIARISLTDAERLFGYLTVEGRGEAYLSLYEIEPVDTTAMLEQFAKENKNHE